MKKIFFFLATLIVFVSGCKRYLDEKPDTKLAVPVTLTDFQALLDNYAIMNNNDPGAGEISADNYYLNDADFSSLSTDNYKRAYTWQNDHLFSIVGNNDWFNTFRPVFTANTVLTGLTALNTATIDQSAYNNIRGQALYERAYAFFQAATLWAQVYDDQDAAVQPGIPVRLGTDFNQNSVRGTVLGTYNQIISDIKSAIPLLPVSPVHVMRPSKPAAYALMARVYLCMRKYDQAGRYADSCLQLNHTLLDYTKLSTTAAYPFSQFNAEVIREDKIPVPAPLNNARARIDPTLYTSYAANDLRKTLYFKASTNGTFVFKGSYEGGANLFAGIATDEVYLIRAECAARAGNTGAALGDLNTLLVTRFKTGTFIPYSTGNNTDALAIILTERRKELLMRGLRWSDLKRLNKDGANISLTRTTLGIIYNLPANSTHYALPLPEDIIAITGMQQNL